MRSYVTHVPRLEDLKWEAPEGETLGFTALVVSNDSLNLTGYALISTPIGEIKVKVDRQGERVTIEPGETFRGHVAVVPDSSHRFEVVTIPDPQRGNARPGGEDE